MQRINRGIGCLLTCWLMLALGASRVWAQHNGTIVGSPTYAAGKFGQAINMLAGNGATFPLAAPLTTGTIQFWINKASAPSGLQVILSGSTTGGYIGITSAGVITWSSGMLTGGTNVCTGSWVHVALTYTGTTEKLYINGVLDTTVSSAYDGTLINPLNLGTNYNGGGSYLFNGAIDDLAISSTMVYTANFTPPATALSGPYAALYHFENSLGDSGLVSATTTVPVTNTALWFSLLNTYSNGTGNVQSNNVKPASTYAQWNSNGGYLKTQFSASATCGLGVDVSPLVAGSAGAGSYPVIKYSVDDGPYITRQLLNSDSVVSLVTGLTVGTNHTLEVVCMSTDTNLDLWNTPVSVLRITGLVLDLGGTVSIPALRTKRMLLYGDSILYGYGVVSMAGSDVTLALGFNLGAAFNAEVGICAYPGSGYESTGNGNAPRLSSQYNLYSNGVARDVTNQPDYVFVMHGTNGGTTQADVAAMITNLRAIYPSAKLFFAVPAGGFARSAITAAVGAQSDTAVYLVDLGSVNQAGIAGGGVATRESPDGLHWYAFIHARIAAAYAQAMQAKMFPYASSTSSRPVKGGPVHK